jgi:hypothetical protein
MKTITFCLGIVLLCAGPVAAQWDSVRMPNVARTADGKVKLDAPPRRINGKPDLSGIWLARPDPLGKPGGVENDILPRYMVNIGADVAPDPTAITANAYADMLLARLKTDGLDDPIAHCKPAGALRLLSIPVPVKIVQTPGLVLLLHEHDQTFREVFTDGRPLPKDPQPRFMGYSIGRWDGDVFEITSTGYTELAWLDAMGHPHSGALTVVERYRRVNTGTLEIDITLTDPKALKQPVRLTQHMLLQPDQELLEYFCAENEKDREHYVAAN